MTLRMADSITAANLPPGYDAYLAYPDGHWATLAAVRARFPGAHVLSVAVFPQDDADGCDCENGDLTAAQVPSWVQRQLRRGVARPVVYASADRMPDVMTRLTGAGISRGQVRLLSAHYGEGAHICGPSTCACRDSQGRTVPACDGTQWTDAAPGLNGSRIDESLLLDDFFGGDVLTPADIDAIARAVWTTDGIVDAPAGHQANPQWAARNVLTWTANQAAAAAAAVAGLTGSVDAGAVADAIVAKLGPGLAAQVAAELGKRLSA